MVGLCIAGQIMLWILPLSSSMRQHMRPVLVLVLFTPVDPVMDVGIIVVEPMKSLSNGVIVALAPVSTKTSLESESNECQGNFVSLMGVAVS